MKENQLEIRFILGFVLIYALFYGLYTAIPNSVLRDVIYHRGIVQPAVSVINTVAPDERVRAVDNRLVSRKASLEIVRGCDGSGVLFLVAAAIIAFSASIKHKLLGVVAGATLIYLANQMRIIVLYAVVAYRPTWFTPLHVYYIPTLLVILCCVFFGWWAWWATRDQVHEPPAAA